jgi:fucose permease
MITAILLLIIYLAFISLGLPDGIIGVAWPEIRQTFGVPLAAAGYITTVGTIGTVFSAFSSGHILKKFGTGKVVCISSALTGLGMLGFAFSRHFFFLLLLAIPLGVGAGAVDTGLNDYVSRHFSPRHMNWLHACWGLGAFTGPFIMTRAIVSLGSWRNGYMIVAAIQLSLALLFLITLPLWTKHGKLARNAAETALASEATLTEAGPTVTTADAVAVAATIEAGAGASGVTEAKSVEAPVRKPLSARLAGGFREIFHRKGLLSGMLLFFFYVGSETCIGLWSASYLRTARNVGVESAGLWVSIYYGSITVGRILAGIVVGKIGTKLAVRIGSAVSVLGFILLLIPAGTGILCPTGLCLIGLGFAPMYPCTMQDTPQVFGKEFSQIAIGYQMGMANIGYTVLPLVIGAISGVTTLWVIPVGAFLFLGAFIFFYEKHAAVHAE